jgi:hypothetical protein
MYWFVGFNIKSVEGVYGIPLEKDKATIIPATAEEKMLRMPFFFDATEIRRSHATATAREIMVIMSAVIPNAITDVAAIIMSAINVYFIKRSFVIGHETIFFSFVGSFCIF